jgi:hypothetical protein
MGLGHHQNGYREGSGLCSGADRSAEYPASDATITLATITGAAWSRNPYIIQHTAAEACTQRIVA